MSTSHVQLRETFAKFWESKPRAHKEVPPAPLVLKEDPTTLFTSSGMQPLVPYLLGEGHPQGKRLYNIQPCFRSSDIDEVGDNRHTTFFEMMGNWSLGDYFKEEQLSWCWEFFTGELGLSESRLFITVFEGGSGVARDEESVEIWKKLGVRDDHIFYYDATKNWWSRAGTPEQMPAGEIGGPDSEVFYDFGEELHLHEASSFKDDKCHPNCDCGRFLEIGNSVFIEYKKKKDGSLEELPQKNVDYGGGFERILAALAGNPDIFATDVFDSIIQIIESVCGKKYAAEKDKVDMRIIVDHLKGATMMLAEGVVPSNKQQGYVARRLLRRVAVKLYDLEKITNWDDVTAVSEAILDLYDGTIVDKSKVGESVKREIQHELDRFIATLDRGMKEFEKRSGVDEKVAFDLYQSYGFPFEITAELASTRGRILNKRLFDKEVKSHQEKSRTAAAGTFRGGLADHSAQTIKYHTATHLLHQALKDVFGNRARQEGSNITAERLRFDVRLDHKPTDEEISRVEAIVNEKIKEALPVYFKIMLKDEAFKIGALAFFKEKYGDQVKVHFIGSTSSPHAAYSKEFCGGPHVKNTREIGSFKITRVKKIGANLVRIYADTGSGESKKRDFKDYVKERWKNSL